MSALWIGHIDVHDEETYGKYISVASEVIPAHGGVFLARGGAFEQFEGRARARQVVARFPSMDAARSAYNDPRYQDALRWAHAASERELLIVEEL
ncbi:MAG: DUF1330 domain-containing protein [Pseudomonadota bacterium]